jgi:hypothetical protein
LQRVGSVVPVLGLNGVAAQRFRWSPAVVTGGTEIRWCPKPATTAVFAGAYMDCVGSFVDII